MIEVETKGKQALLDAFIQHVSPDDYDGDSSRWCLVGQTIHGLWDELTDQERYSDECDVLARRYDVPWEAVANIFTGVSAEHLRNDFEASMDFARHILEPLP